MRALVIAAVMTILVAGLGFAIAPARPAGESSAALAQDADDAAESESFFALDPSAGEAEAPAVNDGAAPAAGARRVFYQWTDERGSVRFAQSLDEVPPAWRDRAGLVEVDTSQFQAKPTRPRVSPGNAARRPFAQAAVAERRQDFHEVTVYTAPWCGWCRKTLAFLDHRKVGYVNKDIEADEDHLEELVEKSGSKSVPFVEIDGTQIRGYNPSEMAALLE